MLFIHFIRKFDKYFYIQYIVSNSQIINYEFSYVVLYLFCFCSFVFMEHKNKNTRTIMMRVSLMSL